MSEEYADIMGGWTTTTNTEKKPTLNQFLRKIGKARLPAQHLVFLIWTPGEFDNFTLETERFRVIIRPSHAFYAVLDKFTSDPKCDSQALAVELNPDDRKQFRLAMSKEKGSWTEVGANGQKWIS